MENKRRADPVDLKGQTILQVIPELETGGAERTAVEVAQAIVRAGGRSFVASEGGALVQDLEAQGSTHIPMPLASKVPWVMRRNAKRLERLINNERVSIIHARSRAPAWSAFWASKATGTRFVTTYHGAYSARTRLKKWYNSVMARADAIIANSAFTAARVRDTFDGMPYFNAARMVTIPRGADLSRFDPTTLSDDRRKAARDAFGGEGCFRLLLPGRLTEWKGQRHLIAAASLLLRQSSNRPLRIVLVGDAQGRDGYEESLRTLIGELGLDAVVHLHGPWADMPAAYDWADVTISASVRPEAFGRVAIEAQAMGCPVVATAHGGSVETVEPDVTGLLVPPSDPEALADAIRNLMTADSAHYARMSEAGRARAAQHFSIEAMTGATLSVYKQLLIG